MQFCDKDRLHGECGDVIWTSRVGLADSSKALRFATRRLSALVRIRKHCSAFGTHELARRAALFITHLVDQPLMRAGLPRGLAANLPTGLVRFFRHGRTATCECDCDWMRNRSVLGASAQYKALLAGIDGSKWSYLPEIQVVQPRECTMCAGESAS